MTVYVVICYTNLWPIYTNMAHSDAYSDSCENNAQHVFASRIEEPQEIEYKFNKRSIV